MAKAKYKYNPRTLSFEKAKMSLKERFGWLGRNLALWITIATIAIFAYSSLFRSPRELILERENKILQRELNVMLGELDTLHMVAADLQRQDDEVYRAIFGAARFPEHLRKPGTGGAERYQNLRGLRSSQDLMMAKRNTDALQKMLTAQSKSMEEIVELARSKNDMLASIPAIQPVDNKNLMRFISGFGYRIHPIYKVMKLHTGMDFTAKEGTEVYATGDGIVTAVEKLYTGYGHHVIIKHGYGYETLYAHLSKIMVRPGQKVKRGEVIGLIGNTGTSVGAHLHYEVIKNGEKVDPAHFFFNDLSPEEYAQLLEKASLANQSLD
jgi:murein DD-endopeptidase MepM/ murein hydrolase activator NlpD